MHIRSLVDSFKVGLGLETFQKLLKIKKKWPSTPEMDQLFQLPGQNTEIHTGFVNCRNNKIGLNAEFYTTKCGNTGLLWKNSKQGQDGYPGLLHGGISTALLDELTQYALFRSKGYFGITVKLNTSFIKPIRIGEVVKGLAKVVHSGNDFIKINAYFFREDGKVASRASATFFLPNLKHFMVITGMKEIPENMHTYFKQ